MAAEKMTCREAKDQVKAYIEGTMSDKECTRFLDHVMNCPDCYDELETYFIIDYSLQYLDDERNVSRSYDMRKSLVDDIKRNRNRIWVTKFSKIWTRTLITISNVLIFIAIALKISLPGIQSVLEHIQPSRNSERSGAHAVAAQKIKGALLLPRKNQRIIRGRNVVAYRWFGSISLEDKNG